ncbi:MAG: zinc ribbon domain-containing protein, partial [Actinomycetota bacterium]|nr:zinc ribbon domain-containing protein [Actinomycetota bacterium]
RDELAGLIPDASLARLDADEAGVWWHGRKRTRVTGRTLSGDGVKEHTKTNIRPVEERVGVPVPALLSRALVDEAHAMLKARKPKTLTHESREWELRGILRCSCGWKMYTHAVRSSGNGRRYFYYSCNQRRQYGKSCACEQKSIPAEDLEHRVWREVGALLSEPGRVLAELDRMISRARGRTEGDPRREERTLVGRLADLDRRRDGYVDLAADGDISREILREKLAQVDAAKREVERELAATRDRGRKVGELEALRDDWASGKLMWFTHADGLDHRSATPEQRRETYRRHRLSVNVEEGGEIVLEGTFGRAVLCGTETPCSPGSWSIFRSLATRASGGALLPTLSFSRSWVGAPSSRRGCL